MYFPVADIEVAVWIPPLASFTVSFFTSMGGISGAFLLLPFQVSFLGYTAPSSAPPIRFSTSWPFPAEFTATVRKSAWSGP